MTILYGTVLTRIGHLLAASDGGRICAIRMHQHPELMEQSFLNDFKRFPVAHKPSHLRYVFDALQEYVMGNRQLFQFPWHAQGSPFEMQVWAALAKIPYGQTRSYSEIAASIGNPKAVRAVANACGENPVPILIPCHRVIQKDGGLGGFSPGVEYKRKLLAIEGMVTEKRAGIPALAQQILLH
jgi:AraC family transcriptional regulator of adaptative response/methylated-DNA-[protein]-cysteine methyltransferase